MLTLLKLEDLELKAFLVGQRIWKRRTTNNHYFHKFINEFEMNYLDIEITDGSPALKFDKFEEKKKQKQDSKRYIPFLQISHLKG